MTAFDQLILRAYQPADVPALHEIDIEFQIAMDFSLPGRPQPYHHEDLDDIEGTYLRDGGAFWVIAASDGEVAGYGAVMRVDDETARLRRFRVRASWRRRGLATRLLTEAERLCREHGYLRVTLGTSDRQEAAQALYRKHGYVEIGRHSIRDNLVEIEFEKVLS